MCFYYSVTKKPSTKLVKANILKGNQESIFDEHYIVSGFEHPLMPVITDAQPDQIQYFQWGYMPDKIFSIEQSDEFYEKYNTLNAKSEEANNSKLYSQAFLNRRCLVLCSGFFEWKLEKKEKIPYYITLKNDELFVFAGIWNKTTDAKGNTLYSYSILTLEANELMANIHNTKKRMPHILTPEAANMWLQPNLSEQQLKELLKPISSEDMKAYTIKKFLPSNIKNINNADIIAYYHYPAMQDLFSNNDLLF